MDYLTELFNLTGKVAVVTGGGGHLCGEMSRALAKAGCSVAVVDLRLEKAESVAKEIRENGGTAIAVGMDASQRQGHMDCLEAVLDAYGRVDILINGAGRNAPTPFLEISVEEWNEVLASQVTSTMFGCQVFGTQMLEQGSGCILNISSASADPPLSKAFTYSVAKAGILNLTKNVAREWATRGVRVNALRPGFFPTEWSQKNFIDADREKAILGHTAMGRYGLPEELSGAVLWLCSDAAGFVTGSEIAVDGGFSCMTI